MIAAQPENRMPKDTKKKKYDDWVNFRSAETKRRLKIWQEKHRQPSLSNAVRIIIEDRLNADGIK